MDHEQFTIRGATGVDLELPIAGPGSRSYAFVIDWHIRVLVALAWLVAAMLLLNGRLMWRPPSGRSGPLSVFIIFLPAAAIYFLYHPVIEVLMRGQTPGKRRAGVRVVDRDGGVPGITAILIRNVFRLLDSLPAGYLLGLTTTFVSAQRIRIGDMAAGTLLVMDDPVAASLFDGIAADRGSGDLASRELAAQVLERWSQLEVARRDGIARELLTIGGFAGPVEAMSDPELQAAVSTLARARAP